MTKKKDDLSKLILIIFLIVVIVFTGVYYYLSVDFANNNKLSVDSSLFFIQKAGEERKLTFINDDYKKVEYLLILADRRIKDVEKNVPNLKSRRDIIERLKNDLLLTEQDYSFMVKTSDEWGSVQGLEQSLAMLGSYYEDIAEFAVKKRLSDEEIGLIIDKSFLHLRLLVIFDQNLPAFGSRIVNETIETITDSVTGVIDHFKGIGIVQSYMGHLYTINKFQNLAKVNYDYEALGLTPPETSDEMAEEQIEEENVEE